MNKILVLLIVLISHSSYAATSPMSATELKDLQRNVCIAQQAGNLRSLCYQTGQRDCATTGVQKAAEAKCAEMGHR